MKDLFQFLIFPGIIFTAVAGCLASWIDRKVTARIQWRVGPPIFQPFFDIVKLLGKEISVPKGGERWTFLFSPLIAFASVSLVSTLLWRIIFSPSTTYVGDLIVVIYLLTISSLCIIISGAASANPFPP